MVKYYFTIKGWEQLKFSALIILRSVLVWAGRVVLGFAEGEYHREQRRDHEQPDGKQLALGVAVAQLHYVDDLRDDRHDQRDGEEGLLQPQGSRAGEVERDLRRPEHDVENEPDMPHSDEMMGYKHIVKGDERFVALLPRLGKKLPLGDGQKNIVQQSQNRRGFEQLRLAAGFLDNTF